MAAQLSSALTQQGRVALRVADARGIAWEDRFAVLQPSEGLFLFPDAHTAHAWRSGSIPATLYNVHLACSCVQMMVRETTTDVFEATRGDYSHALEVSSSHTHPTRIVLGVKPHELPLWLSALLGAAPVADYLVACKHFRADPNEALLRTALASPPIRSVVLEDTPLSLNEAKSLAYLLVSNRVFSLAFINAGLDSEKCLALAELGLRRCSNLTDFSLCENRAVGEDGAMHIIDALLTSGCSEHLKKLELTECNLRDASGVKLAALVSACTGLETLNLAGNNLQGMGAESVCAALPPNLEVLCLDGSRKLGEASIAALCACLPASISTLQLRDTGLTDWALGSLERCLASRSVREVDVRDNAALSVRAQATLLQLAEQRRFRALVSEGQILALDDDRLPMPAALEDQPLKQVIVRFAAASSLAPSQVCEAVALQLGVSKAHVACVAMGRDALVLELPFALAMRLIKAVHSPKMQLLRVAEIAEVEEQTQNRASQHPVLALVAATPPPPEQPPPPSVLARTLVSVCVHGASQAELVRILSLLPPRLAQAISAVLEAMPCPGLAAVAGLKDECDALLARHYDAAADLQLAAVTGNLSRLRGALSRVRNRVGAQFPLARLAAHILANNPDLSIALDTGSGFPQDQAWELCAYEGIDVRAVVELHLCPTPSLRRRPLTVPVGDKFEHASGCARVSLLMARVLDLMERSAEDVDAVAACNDLVGVVLANPGLAGELFCQLACELCSSRVRTRIWRLTMLCVRIVPFPSLSLGRALDALLVRLATPAQWVAACRSGIFLSCSKDLFPGDERWTQGLPRLEFCRYCLRMDGQVRLSVFLPDGSAVVLAAGNCTSMHEALALVDSALATRLNLKQDSPRLRTERWRGWSFMVGDWPVPWSDDLGWLWHRELRWTGARLELKQLVGWPIPLCSDFDDPIRVRLAFAQELRAVETQAPWADDDSCAFMGVLAACATLGETTFRNASAVDVLQTASKLGEGEAFEEAVRRSHAAMLRVPVGDLHVQNAMAAFVALARDWPLSCASRWQVRPFSIVVPDPRGTMMVDKHALPSEAVLVVELARIGLVVSGNALAWESAWSDFESVEVNHARVKVRAAGGSLTVDTPSERDGRALVLSITRHCWALLQCGAVGWHAGIGNDWAARFPFFPRPYSRPRLLQLAVSRSDTMAAGTLGEGVVTENSLEIARRKTPSADKALRVALLVLADELVGAPLACSWFDVQSGAGDAFSPPVPPVGLPPPILPVPPKHPPPPTASAGDGLGLDAADVNSSSLPGTASGKARRPTTPETPPPPPPSSKAPQQQPPARHGVKLAASNDEGDEDVVPPDYPPPDVEAGEEVSSRPSTPPPRPFGGAADAGAGAPSPLHDRDENKEGDYPSPPPPKAADEEEGYFEESMDEKRSPPPSPPPGEPEEEAYEERTPSPPPSPLPEYDDDQGDYDDDDYEERMDRRAVDELLLPAESLLPPPVHQAASPNHEDGDYDEELEEELEDARF